MKELRSKKDGNNKKNGFIEIKGALPTDEDNVSDNGSVNE